MARHFFVLFVTAVLVQYSASNPIPVSTNNQGSLFETKNTYGNIYENKYFNVTAEKPESWHTINTEIFATFIQNIASPILSQISNITGHDETIPPNYLIPLFGFSHYQFGIDNGSVNANFIGIVQNVTRDGLLQNNCDIFSVDLVNLVTDMNVTRAGGCQEIDMNGFKYVEQKSEVQLSNSVTVNQIQYIRSSPNGYLFTFTMTYQNNNERDELLNIMESVRFVV
ncbi:unnamed protein product [Adineta ricciae]|uniref:Uncharacterized protein n=1 Tax=Adineta ricciae TaxID=249248 RepID=A0A814G2B3_ADIRI|nr:unnamed protein product [Adineta ricciae]CAF0990301.1 unnamed protein product [Adineta ricciae]